MFGKKGREKKKRKKERHICLKEKIISKERT